MKKLAAAVILSSVIGSQPLHAQEKQVITQTARPAFFTIQPWEEGKCWGVERKNGTTRSVLYYRRSDNRKTETIMPSMYEGETLLGKECGKDATLIFTSHRILVYPGGDFLFNKPIEERTFWGEGFYNKLLMYRIINKLKFVALFENGLVAIGKVDVKEKELDWKEVCDVTKPEDVEKLNVKGGKLIIIFKNGEKEKIKL
jgi:hypothetical protein